MSNWKYKVVPKLEAVARGLPMWVHYEEEDALEEVNELNAGDYHPEDVLLDPHSEKEVTEWTDQACGVGAWAVVLDSAPVDHKITRAAADRKARIGLIPEAAILGEADAFTYGAEKYAEGNWSRAASDPTARVRYAEGVVRHALRIIAGEVLDSESGLPHWDHIRAGAAMGRETDPEVRGKRFIWNSPTREGAQ